VPGAGTLLTTGLSSRWAYLDDLPMSPLPTLSDVLLRTQTDERLARLAGDGDEWAFAILVKRHRVLLIGLAAAVVGGQRSEDVVQQALLSAWAALTTGSELRNPRAWLAQIVRNTAYTEYGRHRETAELDASDVVDVRAEKVLEQRIFVRELLEEIAALPEHQRKALLDTEVAGRSRRQIAADFGISEGAVRQLVHRARDSLRVAMTAITPYPLIGWISRRSTGVALMHHASRLAGGQGPARSAGAGPSAGATAVGGAALAKGGAVVLAVGAVGAGLAAHSSGPAPWRHLAPRATTAARPTRPTRIAELSHAVPRLATLQAGTDRWSSAPSPDPPRASVDASPPRHRTASRSSSTQPAEHPSEHPDSGASVRSSPETTHADGASAASPARAEKPAESSSESGSAQPVGGQSLADAASGSSSPSTDGASSTPNLIQNAPATQRQSPAPPAATD
jgi:RNA polymerase sigma factor (sigma-70 family)